MNTQAPVAVLVEPRRQDWRQFTFFVGGMLLLLVGSYLLVPVARGLSTILLFVVGFLSIGTLLVGVRLNVSTWWTRVRITRAPNGFPRGPAHLVRHDDAVVIESLQSGTVARVVLIGFALAFLLLSWGAAEWFADRGLSALQITVAVPYAALAVLAGLRTMATPFRATVPHRAITEARREGRALHLLVRTADTREPQPFAIGGTADDIHALMNDLARRGVSVEAGRVPATVV